MLAITTSIRRCSRGSRQGAKASKENKGKRRNKRAIFTNNMIVYIGNPKNHEPWFTEVNLAEL